MNDRLQTALKQLRLSGLAETLDVRLQEAAGHRLGHAEFTVAVPTELASRARELIASHLDAAAAAEVRRISETLGPLEERIHYHFEDIGLLEHALTHRSRAHEDASGGVIDNPENIKGRFDGSLTPSSV